MIRVTPFVVVVLAAFAIAAAPVFAQDAEDHTEGDPLPSLDELLGTEGGASEGGTADTELPEDTAEDDLDRLLSGQEIVDEFRAAVDLMGRSARRLAAARDTGLATQRMQEDVLSKLDKLIDDAQQRSQQSGGSSSSSSSEQQQQQAQQQPTQDSSPEAGQGDSKGDATAPPGRGGPLGPAQAANLAAWGALPARLRDALLQGSSDRFSATYRKLTEAYYRRLAEEPKQ